MNLYLYLDDLALSQTHIGKQISASNNSNKLPVNRIQHRQLPQLHMSEQVNYFGQFICLVAHMRILDHIRSQVNETVVILIANFANFVLPSRSLFNFTLFALYEVFPGQDRLMGWNLIVKERGIITGPSRHH